MIGPFTKHAALRFEERMGMLLTSEDAERMLRDVRDGRATLLGRGSDGSERWAVRCGPKVAHLVLNASHTRVITVLNRDRRQVRPKTRFNPAARRGTRLADGDDDVDADLTAV